MQLVLSRIWTRVAVSISYDDNDYTTGTDGLIILFVFASMPAALTSSWELSEIL